MEKAFYLAGIIGLLIFDTVSKAAELPDLKVKLGATVQALFSYAQTNSDTAQIGFGINRMRIRSGFSLNENIGGLIQFEGSQMLTNLNTAGKKSDPYLNSFKLLDAYLTYNFCPDLQIKAGRFIGAGLRGGGISSHKDLDLVDYPLMASEWGKESYSSDFADYGTEIWGRSGEFSGRVWVHNGKGDENLKPNLTSNASKKTNSLALAAMGSYSPAWEKGLEMGGHIGQGNKSYNDYNDYSVYCYYEKSSFRLKGEYVRLKSQTNRKTFDGFYLFGSAYVTRHIELSTRYDYMDPNVNLDGVAAKDLSFAGTYVFFPESKSTAKLTVEYVVRNEKPEIRNNIFYTQFQVAF